MKQEPVAWISASEFRHIETGGTNVLCKSHEWEDYNIPLYTHPVKELTNIIVASATCSCGKVMEVTNLQPVKELTDEEINKLWAESHEDGIAMQQGFTTQQHYFARAILRKAQEK